jgi:hypothetical protein
MVAAVDGRVSRIDGQGTHVSPAFFPPRSRSVVYFVDPGCVDGARKREHELAEIGPIRRRAWQRIA